MPLLVTHLVAVFVGACIGVGAFLAYEICRMDREARERGDHARRKGDRP